MPALYLIQFAEKKKFRFHLLVFLLPLKDHLDKTVYSHAFVYLYIYFVQRTLAECQACFCQHVLCGQYLIQAWILIAASFTLYCRQASLGATPLGVHAAA